MAAVTLLTGANQNPTGTSTPLDVSAHAILRLDITARADQGKNPQLDVYVDSAQAATGPWNEIHHVRLQAMEPQGSPMQWPVNNIKRATIGDFDAFVRVRWVARATQNSADGNPSLFLGVQGDGV